MKLNWGHWIALSMTAFIAFIVILAVQLMTKDSSVEYKDYYKRGLQHDKQMAMERRTKPYKDSIQVNYRQSKLHLQFPKSLELPLYNLKVQMYRPSSSKLDQNVRIDKPVNDHSVQFALGELVKGSWQARLSWSNHQDSTFYAERVLFVE